MDLAGHGLGEVLAYALELSRLFEHLARLTGHGIAGGREQHLAGGALDEDHSQFIFQLAQLTTQGRLADKAALRRLAKVFLLFQRYQIFEIAKVHRYCILPFNEADSMHKNGAGDKGGAQTGLPSPSPLTSRRRWARDSPHQGGDVIRERRWLSQIGGDRQRNDALPLHQSQGREPLPAEPAQPRLAYGQMAHKIDPTKGQGECLRCQPLLPRERRQPCRGTDPVPIPVVGFLDAVQQGKAVAAKLAHRQHCAYGRLGVKEQ